MFGTLSMLLSATIITVAIPSIMVDFSMSQGEVQWLVTGFLAAMTASMLSLDWLLESLGQRATFVGGFALFIAASLLGGLAPSGDWLIAARVLQGAMAGVVQPLAMIIIFQVFPPGERGLGMGIYGMGVLLGPAIGPVVGGVLVDTWSWRAVFLVILPFCVAGMIMGLRFLPTREIEKPRRAFDWLGLALLVAALTSLLWAFANGPRLGWSTPLILGLLGCGSLAGFAFVRWELYHSKPMLNLQVFRSKEMVCGSLLSFAHGMVLYGTTYLIPLFMQDIQGLSATDAGMVLIPAGLAMAAVFPLGGYLSDRLPPRISAVAAVLCLSLSSLLLMQADRDTGFWLLACWIVLGRVGLGLLNPPVVTGSLRSLPGELLTHGSGALSFCRQLGTAFGVNLLVVILAQRTGFHSRLLSQEQSASETELLMQATRQIELQAHALSFQDSFLVLGLVLLLALVPAWLMGKETGRS